MTSPMTYAGSGVNYAGLDPFKLAAQAAAKDTDWNANRFGAKVVGWTRGESVFVVEIGGMHIGFVIEGLGTKNLVADHVRELVALSKELQDVSRYDAIAQCCVAMIVNDMITLGVMPVVIGMHPAVAGDDWFKDAARNEALIRGWKNACTLSGCIWGPGETPALSDIIVPGTVALSGAGWGIAKQPLFNPASIAEGDWIVMLGSSGIHANGLTLARKIAKKLPKGYATELPDGRTYGETLLDPTNIYVGFVEACLKAGADIHYAVNITGHGWRKLMRADQSFAYVIDQLPTPLPIFDFIQEHGPVEEKEAYGNLNMGAGFALFIPEESRVKVWDVGMRMKTPRPFEIWHAGQIERSEAKKVVIRPKKLEFSGETLAVR